MAASYHSCSIAVVVSDSNAHGQDFRPLYRGGYYGQAMTASYQIA